MIWLIVVLGLTAGVMAFLVQSLLMLLAVVVSLSVLIYAALTELASVDESIGQILNSDGEQSDLREEGWLSVSAHIWKNLQALRYRLQQLVWSEVSSRRQVSLEVPIPKQVPQPEVSDPKKSFEESFLSQVLSEVRGNFRSSALAAMYLSRQNSDPIIVSQGVAGTRFESTLRHVFKEYFARNDKSFFGLRDGWQSSGILGDFSIFGYRYAVSFPFELGDGAKGLIWLGYSEQVSPLEKEVADLKAVCQSVALKMLELRKVHQLAVGLREAENISKAKDDFLAHMSHDIRSPLNNIRAIMNLVKLEGITPETPEMLDMALTNCDQMAEIVEDVLDFSKYQSGLLRAREEVFDLKRILNDVVAAFAITAKIKGLNLILREAKPAFVTADCKHVKRILINLVSNAIKYTIYGGIEIWVESREPGSWSIMVKDSGVGMNQSQLEQLFTPFTRFHTSVEQGFGLGLALSKVLAQASGADIKVTSVEGQGSLFEFQLRDGPAYLAAAPRPSSQFIGSALGMSQSARPKILLVEDDFDCLQSQARLLESYGFEVLCATSVAEALALINYDRIDFIVTDACMPNAGGKDLLLKLVESANSTPVLVVTGLQDKEDEFLQLGASRVLLKPVDVNDILLWIEDCGAKLIKQAVNS